MREASDLDGFGRAATKSERDEKRARRAKASRERLRARGQLTHRERQASKRS